MNNTQNIINDTIFNDLNNYLSKNMNTSSIQTNGTSAINSTTTTNNINNSTNSNVVKNCIKFKLSNEKLLSFINNKLTFISNDSNNLTTDEDIDRTILPNKSVQFFTKLDKFKYKINNNLVTALDEKDQKTITLDGKEASHIIKDETELIKPTFYDIVKNSTEIQFYNPNDLDKFEAQFWKKFKILDDDNQSTSNIKSEDDNSSDIKIDTEDIDMDNNSNNNNKDTTTELRNVNFYYSFANNLSILQNCNLNILNISNFITTKGNIINRFTQNNWNSIILLNGGILIIYIANSNDLKDNDNDNNVEDLNIVNDIDESVLNLPTYLQEKNINFTKITLYPGDLIILKPSVTYFLASLNDSIIEINEFLLNYNTMKNELKNFSILRSTSPSLTSVNTASANNISRVSSPFLSRMMDLSNIIEPTLDDSKLASTTSNNNANTNVEFSNTGAIESNAINATVNNIKNSPLANADGSINLSSITNNNRAMLPATKVSPNSPFSSSPNTMPLSSSVNNTTNKLPSIYNLTNVPPLQPRTIVANNSRNNVLNNLTYSGGFSSSTNQSGMSNVYPLQSTYPSSRINNDNLIAMSLTSMANSGNSSPGKVLLSPVLKTGSLINSSNNNANSSFNSNNNYRTTGYGTNNYNTNFSTVNSNNSYNNTSNSTFIPDVTSPTQHSSSTLPFLKRTKSSNIVTLNISRESSQSPVLSGRVVIEPKPLKKYTLSNPGDNSNNISGVSTIGNTTGVTSGTIGNSQLNNSGGASSTLMNEMTVTSPSNYNFGNNGSTSNSAQNNNNSITTNESPATSATSTPTKKKLETKRTRRNNTSSSKFNRDEIIMSEFGKIYVCQECKRQFSSGHHLTRHKKSVHSGEKPYSCPKCGKKFKRRDHVLQHLNKKIPCIPADSDEIKIKSINT